MEQAAVCVNGRESLSSGLPWTDELGRYVGPPDELEHLGLSEDIQKMNNDRPPVSACQRNSRLCKTPVTITQIARPRSISSDRAIDPELRRISRRAALPIPETTPAPEPVSAATTKEQRWLSFISEPGFKERAP